MFMLGLGVAAPGVGRVIEAVFPNENWGVNPELLLGGLMFKKAAPPNPEDWVVDEVLDSPSVFAAPKENADFPEAAAEPKPVPTDPKPDGFPKVGVAPEPNPLPNVVCVLDPPPKILAVEEVAPPVAEVCSVTDFSPLSFNFLSMPPHFLLIFSSLSLKTILYAFVL